jgi:hypothetical protein
MTSTIAIASNGASITGNMTMILARPPPSRLLRIIRQESFFVSILE